jgi:hypothetical protein
MSDDPARPDMAPGDEAPPERAETGADMCAECGGSGRRDGDECAACGGTGRVEEAVGGG